MTSQFDPEQTWAVLEQAPIGERRFQFHQNKDVILIAMCAGATTTGNSGLAYPYTPAEALVMATSTTAELLSLFGKRNPYPGKLGVAEQGAFAYFLLERDPTNNIKIITKYGNIYKDALTR